MTNNGIEYASVKTIVTVCSMNPKYVTHYYMQIGSKAFLIQFYGLDEDILALFTVEAKRQIKEGIA
jgi:hypothetical protein